MLRETKFGYGFLLVGTGVPYLIDKLFGLTWAIVLSVACVVIGGGFLIAGHRHKEQSTQRGRWEWLASIAALSTLIVLGSIGALRMIHDKRTQPPEGAEVAKKAPLLQPEPHPSAPTKPSVRTPPPKPPRLAATAEEIANEVAKRLGASQETKLCHPENNQLVDCTDAVILDWGKPLLQRLQDAIQENESKFRRRHEQYWRDHNETTLKDMTIENATLNQYLTTDYKNFVIYRAAVLSRLKGGDPTAYDPLQTLALSSIGHIPGDRILLSDADSHRFDAEVILRDLQDLTGRLARQVEQESGQ